MTLNTNVFINLKKSEIILNVQITQKQMLDLFPVTSVVWPAGHHIGELSLKPAQEKT